jgi:hypothetical protein
MLYYINKNFKLFFRFKNKKIKMYGSNGSGRRLLTGGSVYKHSRRGRRGRRGMRGRGFFDTIKKYGEKAINFIKGNKSIQDYGKKGLEFLGNKAKDVIEAKANQVTRQLNQQNQTPASAPANVATLKKKPFTPAYMKNPLLRKRPIKSAVSPVTNPNAIVNPTVTRKYATNRGTGFAPPFAGGSKKRRSYTGHMRSHKSKRIGGAIRKHIRKLRGKGNELLPPATAMTI